MVHATAGCTAGYVVKGLVSQAKINPDVLRKQVEYAFEQADEWTESQIKSPAFMKLQQALRIKWGGVLVFTCPYGSGKTVALKDLTARMRADKVPVKYLDARKNARDSSSACHFLFTSLGLPMAAARIDLGELLPIKEGSEDRTTIIIDHFEDLMHFPDAPMMIRSLARELYAMDDPVYRVLVCVSGEDYAQKVVEYNGCNKIRLALWPLSARWSPEHLTLVLEKETSFSALDEREREDVKNAVVRCGSPGKVRELILLSPKPREEFVRSAEDGWAAMEKLRPIVLKCGCFRHDELDADLSLSVSIPRSPFADAWHRFWQGWLL